MIQLMDHCGNHSVSPGEDDSKGFIFYAEGVSSLFGTRPWNYPYSKHYLLILARCMSAFRISTNLGDYVILFKPASLLGWMVFNLNLMGLQMVLNESNILIRYFFERFHLEPQKLQVNDSVQAVESKSNEKDVERRVDEREYKAGRIIGSLERIFVFIAVVNNEFSTIGFILAIKAFARSKELENRSFAEYVLVSTLVSTSIAILVGQLTLMLAQML